jgi:hypothetical protein
MKPTQPQHQARTTRGAKPSRTLRTTVRIRETDHA